MPIHCAILRCTSSDADGNLSMEEEPHFNDVLPLAQAAAQIEEGMPFGFGPPYIDKPSHELWGEIALASGDSRAAAAAFEAALARAPQRAMSVAGLARAKAAGGN